MLKAQFAELTVLRSLLRKTKFEVQLQLDIDREPTRNEANDWIIRVAEENGFDIDFVWNSQIDPSAFVKTTFPEIDYDPESVI